VVFSDILQPMVNWGNSVMVYRLLILVLLGIFLSSVYSQDNSLQITANPMDDSSSDFEITFIWSSTSAAGDGLGIQVPLQVKMVPRAVRVNDQELWLKKSLEKPEQPSVVCWTESGDGLLLFFADGFLQGGSNLEVSCHAGITASVSDTTLASIRAVNLQGGNAEVSSNILTQGNFPAISKQIEN
jgi:hypothetical protein